MDAKHAAAVSIVVKPIKERTNTISTKHNCLRKLLHTDYLSAIQHAARVPDNDSVVIYPCGGCGEKDEMHLHVGHSMTDPIWKLKRQIARTDRRLSQSAELLLTAEIGGEGAKSLQQSIRDRRAHLERLRANLAALTKSTSR